MNITARFDRFSRLLLACVIAPACAVAAGAAGPSRTATPDWPVAAGMQNITTAAAARTLAGDEAWTATTGRYQDLDTGDATRTITLAPVGSDGVAAGTTFVTRVHVRSGHRVLFRDSNGGLLASWSGDSAGATQWATLRATAAGWEARVSTGRQLEFNDGAFAWLGAEPSPRTGAQDERYAVPADPRTCGFAIRFETDAPLFFVTCRADQPRFRVVADGRIVAEVAVSDATGLELQIPIALEGAARRRIEILAESLQFRGVALPDVRQEVAAWVDAVPRVRMLWIGDSTTDEGTHSYPWLVGNLLGYEVWNRRWGHNAQHVTDPDGAGVPTTAIAEDIAKLNPDLVVFGGRFFNEALSPREYRRVVSAWLDAIKPALRPEAVAVILPDFTESGPVDRLIERRGHIVGQEAKARGFFFVNWQGWITGDVRTPELGGNAPQYISANRVHPTTAGHAFLATRLADQLGRRDVGSKAQLAALKRLQAHNLASTASLP